MEAITYGFRNDGIMDFDIEESSILPEHTHQDIEVMFCLEGELPLTVGKSCFVMKKDDIIVIDSGKSHAYRARGNVLAGILHLNYYRLFDYLDLDSVYFRCNSVVDKNKGYQEMKRLLNKIFRLYFDKGREKIYLNSLYFELLHVMTVYFSCQRDFEDGDGSSRENTRMREIERYVRANYQEAISLNDIADHFYLTTSYLSKYFKKKTGTNFVNYLNQIRLKSAVEDMKHSQKSITRVALDNGFPNTAAFSGAFKKEYGTLPSIWLKDYLEQQKKQEEEQKLHSQEKENVIRNYLERKREETAPVYPSAKQMMTVDGEKFELYEKNWNQMINIGSVQGLLRSALQEHLLILKREIGFTYVRFWDIFSEDMLIDIKRADGKYNFKRLDTAFDFLVRNGLHPFIELGFKPYHLLRTTDNTIISQEREVPFTQVSDCAKVLHPFMAHFVNRYGLSEVEQWYFEQWCDPRLTRGKSYGDYFALFEQEYHVLKSISPNILVGGAGFGRLYSTLDFQEILDLWKKRMIYPDFISMYGYPYMARSSQDSQNNDRIQDPNFINNQVMMMREGLNRASMHIKKLMLTEWSSSVSDWNSLNDSMYKGAFMLKSILDNVGALDMMGYWLASDVLTEYFDTGMLLHGGNGLLSADGIKKPAFYAMQFAAKMYDRLLGRDEHSMVTANGRGSYYILCHNYINPNFRYYLKKEDEIEPSKQFLLFDEAKELPLRFQIRNIRNGKYLVKIRSLSQEHGSVLDEWAQMDYLENLSQQDIQYLKDISTPKIMVKEYMVQKNILEIETVLQPQEIQAIHLIYHME